MPKDALAEKATGVETLQAVQPEDAVLASTCWDSLVTHASEWKIRLASCLAAAHGMTSVTGLLLYGTYVSIMTGNVLFFSMDCIGAASSWWANRTVQDSCDPTQANAQLRCALHSSVLASYISGFVAHRAMNTLLGGRTTSSAAAIVTFLLFLAVDLGRGNDVWTDAVPNFELPNVDAQPALAYA